MGSASRRPWVAGYLDSLGVKTVRLTLSIEAGIRTFLRINRAYRTIYEGVTLLTRADGRFSRRQPGRKRAGGETLWKQRAFHNVWCFPSFRL